MNYDRFAGLRFSRRMCEQWRTDANYACAIERFERPFKFADRALYVVAIVAIIVVLATA